ncbi:MAG: FAD-dependent oxidoreductase [Myxococcota bacterium]
MAKHQSRANFLRKNPSARAWAALRQATAQQASVTPGAVKLKPKQHHGKRAIVIGSGVGGLTTAYELLEQDSGMEVTVLEARHRTGGRCLSLRTGDTLIEDADSELFDSKPGEPQVVRFKRPLGDAEPYLNAGPGRIPSSHKRLLSYLEQFGVDVEVYVMNSGSNLVQMEGGPFESKPVVYRRLEHNTRGWLAELVFNNAETLLEQSDLPLPDDDEARKALLEKRTEQLQELMVSFGELTEDGEFSPTAGQSGLENGRTRSGYDVLPGVAAGETASPLPFDELLESEFWRITRFYQPVDFLWQPTLFQPVGGMDRVQHAFAQKVSALGGTIHLNSPVKHIDWDPDAREFVVKVQQLGTEELVEYRADYCFCNLAMPFLSRILSERLQGGGESSGLSDPFKASLRAVYEAQFNPPPPEEGSDYQPRFLADTTKVGWQAARTSWQGSTIVAKPDSSSGEDLLGVPDSEIGVVPIFGGISWTDDEIAQIWYPSCDYHGKLGVLTGAYNFSEVANEWGKLDVGTRLHKAREGAKRFGEAFGDGLTDGLAIAWQNMAYIKGGWAQWHVVDSPVEHFNTIAQGSGVHDAEGNLSDPVFFIVGDQVSSLPGWQEGAIASALNALSRVSRPDLAVQHLDVLPDTRIICEGI